MGIRIMTMSVDLDWNLPGRSHDLLLEVNVLGRGTKVQKM